MPKRAAIKTEEFPYDFGQRPAACQIMSSLVRVKVPQAVLRERASLLGPSIGLLVIRGR